MRTHKVESTVVVLAVGDRFRPGEVGSHNRPHAAGHVSLGARCQVLQKIRQLRKSGRRR